MSEHKRLIRGIYKRGKVYWLAIQKEKKRHFVSLGTGDFSEALLKATRLRHSPALESGALISHAVERFVDHMVARTLWSRSSRDSRGYVLKAFARSCGHIMPSDVDPSHVQNYHTERLKRCSESTAYSAVGVISRFFDWCRDEEKTVRENPCAGLNLPYPEKAPRKSFCTPAQVEKLLGECPREDLRFVLFCGFHAGFRAIEIVEAVPQWFDQQAQQIHLRKTPTCRFKDREERSLPLTKKFAAFLENYGLPDPFMLHPEKAHAKSRYRWDFKRPFAAYMKEQGCAWVTPHIMRHTYASLLASAGESIYVIANWLGDDVRTVQAVYAKLLPIRGKVDSAFQAASSRKSSGRKASTAASSLTRS